MKRSILIIFLQLLFLSPSLPCFGQAIKSLERGRRALALGDFGTAENELNYCLRLNPTTPYAYAFLAKAYYYQSKYTKAIYAFNKALETDYTTRLNGDVELIYHNTVSLGLEEQEMLDPALMYYQKGRVHHLKRNTRMAISDMERALSLNPYFEEAKVYLDHIRSGKGPLLIESPITFTDINTSNPKTEKRPESIPGLLAEDDRKSSGDVRRARTVYFKLDKPRSRSERKLLKNDVKRKFSQGQKLINPQVGFAAQTYITIESIQFTSNQTIVNFKVENPSEDSAFVLRLDEDMKITSREGGRGNFFRMVRISNFSRTGTKLPAGGKLRFAITFPAVPEDMTYFNIVEGNRNDGQEWNFYDVYLVN